MTSELCYSLLDEPLLTVRTMGGDRRGATLPDVLAGLSRDDIASFEALQAHQRQAWFCFLAQLGALGLDRTGRESLPDEAGLWRRMLLELSDGKEGAWSLAVDELSRPGFMQPPVPEGCLSDAGFKTEFKTPALLDMLVTSKNHDVKRSRIFKPAPEHWIYALVTLQTMEGFMGRGNYGIFRMNGGFGSRPLVELAPGLRWGLQFQRDVRVLVAARGRILEEFEYDMEGYALLWLEPWDGAKSSGLPLAECHPYVIEACRRIRFISAADGQLSCLGANTKGTRINAPEDLNGVTGDPWTPVDLGDSKALNVGSGGFSYDRLADIFLTGEYQKPPALEHTDEERNGGYLVATALARGQGQTDGFHHRIVPVPPRVSRCLLQESERQRLGQMAKQRVELASKVENNVLRPALYTLFNAGSDGEPDADRARPWTNAFDEKVDDVFFHDLWRSVDMSGEEAARCWQERLYHIARNRLEDAINSTPLPSMRRYRAISEAESIFEGMARTHLTKLFEEPEGEETHEPAAAN